MARKAKLLSLRQRIQEQIEAEIETAKQSVSLANDLTDLLNMIPDGEPKLEKKDNVILGAFKKPEERK